MRHTPGPWRLGADSGRIVAGPRGLHIANVVTTGMGTAAGANFSLIAAAPDLLAALDQLLNVTVDKDLKEGWTLSDDARIARDQAIAAIAKATQGA